MPFNDDKFGMIWPTRTGDAIGGSRERQMLDAIGGADSFRTRVSQNPDGSTTIMRSRNGMPHFETSGEKKKSEIVIDEESLFYGVPSSADHLNGYTPTNTPPFPGASSKWKNYHTRSARPVAYGVSDSGSGVFTPFEDAAISRGSLTWYSSSVVDGNQLPVVISWRGFDSRAGKFCKTYAYELPGEYIHGGDIGEWNAQNNSNRFVRMGSFTVTDTRVWVGHGLILDTGVPVYSAALKKEAAGTYLYVISERTVYRGLVSIFTVSGGYTILKRGTASVAMAPVGSIAIPFAHWRYIQAPFINQSGTKAAILVDGSGDGMGEWQAEGGSGETHLYELDLVSLAVSHKAETALKIISAAYSDTRVSTSGADSSSDILQSVVSARGRTVNENLSAADYRNDTLVWVFIRATSYDVEGFLDYSELSNSSTSNYVYSNVYPLETWDYDYAATYTRNLTFDKYFPGEYLVEIVHSTDGVILSKSIGSPATSKLTLVESVSASVSYHFNRTIDRTIPGAPTDTSTPNPAPSLNPVGTWSIPASTTHNLLTKNAFLCNADLRTDCVAAVMKAKYTVFSGNATTGAYAYPGGSGTITGTEYTREDYVPLLLVFGVDKSPSLAEYSAATSPAPASIALSISVPPTAAPYVPYNQTTTVASYTLSYPTVTPFSMFAITQTYPTYDMSPYCHLATDYDRRVAYVGWNVLGSASQQTVIEGFYFRNKTSGAVVADTIPTATYAPGQYSSIYSPVFFPEYITNVRTT